MPNAGPWYLMPGWWGLIGALISIVISICALRFSRRGKRADVVQSLIRQAVEINDAFVRYGVDGPYRHHLRLTREERPDFDKKGALLLNHLNLLHMVFMNRDILTRDMAAGYLKWARDIVRPWIESDADLTETWRLAAKSGDLLGAEFIRWLTPYFPR